MTHLFGFDVINAGTQRTVSPPWLGSRCFRDFFTNKFIHLKQDFVEWKGHLGDSVSARHAVLGKQDHRCNLEYFFE